MSETSKRSADFKDVYMGLPPPNKPRDLAEVKTKKKKNPRLSGYISSLVFTPVSNRIDFS